MKCEFFLRELYSDSVILFKKRLSVFFRKHHWNMLKYVTEIWIFLKRGFKVVEKFLLFVIET